MASYQNIFTQIQLRGAPELGPGLPKGDAARSGKPGFSYWMGKLGNAQLGPIYLGTLGTLSLVFGLIAFEIIGLNMWASVNWDPVQFVRQLFWLALEPPGPEWGFSPFVPLNQGGWFILAGSRGCRRWRRAQRYARAAGHAAALEPESHAGRQRPGGRQCADRKSVV